MTQYRLIITLTQQGLQEIIEYNQIDTLTLQTESAGFGNGQILQVVGETAEMKDFLVQRREACAIGLRQAILQRLDLAAKVRERCAQFVRHVADHAPA